MASASFLFKTYRLWLILVTICWTHLPPLPAKKGKVLLQREIAWEVFRPSEGYLRGDPPNSVTWLFSGKARTKFFFELKRLVCGAFLTWAQFQPYLLRTGGIWANYSLSLPLPFLLRLLWGFNEIMHVKVGTGYACCWKWAITVVWCPPCSRVMNSTSYLILLE